MNFTLFKLVLVCYKYNQEFSHTLWLCLVWGIGTVCVPRSGQGYLSMALQLVRWPSDSGRVRCHCRVRTPCT